MEVEVGVTAYDHVGRSEGLGVAEFGASDILCKGCYCVFNITDCERPIEVHCQVDAKVADWVIGSFSFAIDFCFGFPVKYVNIGR